ncbi:hypothetical protein BU15DRAFT_54211 [Melanogaster broomeanus]|nr:hypothetical protein BU15DRAFT_54211 [Melanogaster broomeanus]
MRASRAPSQKSRAIERAKGAAIPTPPWSVSLKEKNIITNTSRDMICELVANLDVPVASVQETIRTVANGLGVLVEGEISSRSVQRVVKEAEVAADIQMVEEIACAGGITFSSDGTTHKNISYQSHHITYSTPNGKGVTRFAGIGHEVNHTSDTQLEGWKELINRMCTVYDACMAASGQEKTMNPLELVAKVKGFLTDHAEDQKKLVRLFIEWKEACEREVRGRRAISVLPPNDVATLLWQVMDGAVGGAGGPEGWDALPAEVRKSRTEDALRQLHIQLGKERFASLSDEEKDAVDFFVWAGCCMHKELNAVKGGNARMQAWWGVNGMEGPILLMNRDNVAAVASLVGDPDLASLAASRTVKVSQRGAVKALSLAGAVFRHKDDKKGQQDSLRFFLEANLGYFCPWPDTSNIRYQSNCDAACEWLVHREMYITYLELVMDKKETRTHTNIEHNVYDAFHCDKTTQEMICLAIWGQCISHPYLCNVRSSGDNILDLGPLHSRLVSHVKNLLANPDLVLSPEATFSSATLDGTPFERPEVIYVVQSLVQDKTHFPHIRPLFAAYLEGALETVERFSAEFAPGGAIAKSTGEQRKMARMNTTNDVNEGALGTLRVAMRRAPQMSLAHFNARTRYKRNRTGTYIKKFLNARARKYLRKKARVDDASGIERKRRDKQAKYDRELVLRNRMKDQKKKERQELAAAKMAAIVPRLTREEVVKLRVPEIDVQIRWHRRFDAQVPAAKDLKGKKRGDKVEILMDAVGRFLSGEVRSNAADGTAMVSGLELGVEYGDGSDREMHSGVPLANLNEESGDEDA